MSPGRSSMAMVILSLTFYKKRKEKPYEIGVEGRRKSELLRFHTVGCSLGKPLVRIRSGLRLGERSFTAVEDAESSLEDDLRIAHRRRWRYVP